MSVGLEPARCLHARLSSFACARCIDACPEEALSGPTFDAPATVRLDATRCTDCALCVAACPTDAIAAARELDPIAIVEAQTESETPVIGCRLGPGPSGRHVDCLGQLGDSDLVALRVLARRPVQLDATECEACPRGAMLPALAARVAACAALELGERSSIAVVTDRRSLRQREPQLTRRDFLGWFRARAATSASERPRASAGDGRKPLARSQRLLATVAARLAPDRRRQLRRATDFRLRFSASCDRCGRCAAACPTGALRRHRENGRRSVGFAPERCTGCGLCVEFCPLRAVEVAPPGAPPSCVAATCG